MKIASVESISMIGIFVVVYTCFSPPKKLIYIVRMDPLHRGCRLIFADFPNGLLVDAMVTTPEGALS